MKKVLKYTVAVAFAVFLLYSGVYFEDLEKVRRLRQQKAFDPAKYARHFWDNQLIGVLDRAVDVGELIELFNSNMAEAVRRYGKAPGVSRVYAYLLTGEGKIVAVGEDGLQVSVRGPQDNPDVLLATGLYIPGNAVRDASGLIDVSKFSDTMKFNEISGEINKIVVKEVIKPFMDEGPGVGMTVKFYGATQVAQDATEEHLFGELLDNTGDKKEFQLVTIVPIKLELKEP
jgi:predicted lipoprotein